MALVGLLGAPFIDAVRSHNVLSDVWPRRMDMHFSVHRYQRARRLLSLTSAVGFIRYRLFPSNLAIASS
jgi:hypothetical protein